LFPLLVLADGDSVGRRSQVSHRPRGRAGSLQARSKRRRPAPKAGKLRTREELVEHTCHQFLDQWVFPVSESTVVPHTGESLIEGAAPYPMRFGTYKNIGNVMPVLGTGPKQAPACPTFPALPGGTFFFSQFSCPDCHRERVEPTGGIPLRWSTTRASSTGSVPRVQSLQVFRLRLQQWVSLHPSPSRSILPL
jgi:hypothetical protein